MTDDRLESALRALGGRLDVPAPPPVTDAVLARLDERPARWRRARRVLAAAVAALVALATAMVVSPAVRAAVHDLLRIGGVAVHQDQPAPPLPVDPALPGERDVSLAEARAAAAFPLRLPAELGDPSAVRLADDAAVVSMVFTTPHGEVRVDQFDGGLAPMFTKFSAAADVHPVTVSGGRGVWVDRPHPVLYTGRDGTTREGAARLAGSTLIWERDGVTYRVEGDLTEARAVTIAESMR